MRGYERNLEVLSILNTATTHKQGVHGLEYNYPLANKVQITHTKEEKALVTSTKRVLFTEVDINRANARRRRALRLNIDFKLKKK